MVRLVPTFVRQEHVRGLARLDRSNATEAHHRLAISVDSGKMDRFVLTVVLTELAITARVILLVE